MSVGDKVVHRCGEKLTAAKVNVNCRQASEVTDSATPREERCVYVNVESKDYLDW